MIAQLIEKFRLESHPEGGFFAETHRSDTHIKHGPEEIIRCASTAIYFLITPGSVSRLHKIKSDEVWHFYLGGPMTVIELDLSELGHFRATKLGHDVMNGELVQYTVKKGTWFGSFPDDGTEFSFVGCTVSPGFEFEDFELGSRGRLIEEFPDAIEVITKLTEGLP